MLHGSAALAASVAAAPVLLQGGSGGGSRAEELRFAVIGLRQRGLELRRALALVPNSRVTALCDVDSEVLERERAAAQKVLDEGGGGKVAAVADLRRVLDRTDVDAVLIATPNHWHALAAIWALQAGKHVYVEKPVSHSVWEGEQMARAVRRSKLVAQAGTQNRSDSGLRGLAEWRRSNDPGKARWAHAVWYRVRASIGKVAEPTPVPPGVDLDLFCGPRPVTPVMRKSFHYDWHWQWPFGNGEVGNLGAHLIDDVRNQLGLGLPTRVMQAGARLAWDDDGETPNVSMSVFDYGGLAVVLELRNLPLVPGGAGGPTLRGRGSGVLIRYERGWSFSTRAFTAVYGEDGTELGNWRGDGGKEHLRNFAQAIRRDDRSLLAAPLEDAAASAATCHLANLAWRAGRAASYDEIRDAVGSIDPAHSMLDSLPAHLAPHGIDLSKQPLRMGGWLQVAEKETRFASGPEHEAANALLREGYREPFVVPDLG